MYLAHTNPTPLDSLYNWTCLSFFTLKSSGKQPTWNSPLHSFLNRPLSVVRAQSVAGSKTVLVRGAATTPTRGTDRKVVDEVCRPRPQSRPLWPPAWHPHNARASPSYPVRSVRVGLHPCRTRSNTPWCGRGLIEGEDCGRYLFLIFFFLDSSNGERERQHMHEGIV